MQQLDPSLRLRPEVLWATPYNILLGREFVTPTVAWGIAFVEPSAGSDLFLYVEKLRFSGSLVRCTVRQLADGSDRLGIEVPVPLQFD
eukprot:2543978-Alexandrium_andersonii.AAC.1